MNKLEKKQSLDHPALQYGLNVLIKKEENIMSKGRVSVKIESKAGSEEAYFKEQEQKQIKELRETASKEANEKYCEEHKYHCFRCGTRSLVQVDREDIKIDICVNENCGAVHLDPGELEEILKNEKVILGIRKSVLSIFTK
jgi:hypothetical protein